MKKAIYAFSGDPITYGHIDIVKRASKIFDEVVVGIGQNPEKNYMFTLEERTDMAKRALSNMKNVRVVSFTGLLVDFAYENNIPVIIKGIRNNTDFDYEVLLHSMGDSQKLGIETFIVPAKRELAHISSSTVKALQSEQGLINEYVPLYVKQMLEARMSGQFIIGVTGEIGTGKSFVCEKLKEIGDREKVSVHHIELDHIGHRILGELKDPSYEKIRKEIIESFGSKVKLKNGFISRKELGEIVFSDNEKLKKLNSIMRKPMLVRLRKELAEKRGLILFNAALLSESEMTYLCNNNVILITADKKSQERRMKKRGLSKEQIERRLSSQYKSKEKKQKIKEQIKKYNNGKIWLMDNSDGDNLKKIEKMFNEIVLYASNTLKFK
ncbi:MAG TPA: pantetheine-phosphate adenylyltransferase [bacterium]|nr:pantetheine-phosphate adenylyltransferase [bacterium]